MADRATKVTTLTGTSGEVPARATKATTLTGTGGQVPARATKLIVLTATPNPVPARATKFVVLTATLIPPAIEFEPALGGSFGPILWIEFDAPTGEVTAWGQVDLPDPADYYHGFKPATILGGPIVRRAMSNDDDGTDEIGRLTARFSDVDRYWAGILGRDDLKRLVLNRRVVLRMISDDGRRALETPRTVSIGLIRSYELT